MRALVYLGPRRMELQKAPDPTPRAGEVIIATLASAVCGSDLHGFREASPRRIPPLVMGHETVGVIDAVGEGVAETRVGERVVLKPILACGECARCREGRSNVCVRGRLVGRDLPGGFADRFAVPASAAVVVPDSVGNERATLVEPVANAVHVTERSTAPRDVVVVIGAGPIGVLMAALAARRGAGAVLAIDPLPARRSIAERNGARGATPDDAETAVTDLTGGDGADVVIDAVGIPATWGTALRLARSGGRVEAVGLGAPRGEIDFFAVAGKELTIAGSFGWTEPDFATALDLVTGGAIDTDGWFSTFALREGQRAFEELVDHAAHFKALLVPERVPEPA
jgi:2-desacetyl-2-hydroxyethyl bacteriochlorophyllide A dehydrogenase